MASKVVVSECRRAWLFNVAMRDNTVRAGFACFLPGLGIEIRCGLPEGAVNCLLPQQVANNSMPVRVVNARLPVV